ncbi:probable 28S ribosomal protein S10, mitochondrial [Clupea harengus]|uniref:Small ribosomal subunit protein uS10m n=1 Tax=Clupea harengus TaxID=7950 RepID=A0A6P3VWA9_CLUHA|nr:probable 28S ribosomal protein S10, mitochondrial [Clupea harengus]
MAAPIVIVRNVGAVARTVVRTSRALHKVDICGMYDRQAIFSQSWRLQTPATFHTASVFRSAPAITVIDEPDILYQKVEVLVKGHDKTVLDSYEFFATLAAKELGIGLGKVYEPPKHIEKLTVLKSVHIFKKHRVQYEMRTHYRCIELSRVTGSTVQVYLEYIQRNLPEGVAMEVTKTAIEKVPEHIQKPMWDDAPKEEQASQ